MPTAVPMMPASASGVSMTRSGPNSSCSPLVARNTPPNLPTSSPSTTTFGSRCISVRSASLTAWMMFIVGMAVPDPVLVLVRALHPRQREEVVALLDEVPGHLLVDVVEHRLDRRHPEVLRPRQRAGDRLVVLLDDLALVLLRPHAALAEVAAQAVDRVLLVPGHRLARVAVDRRVVRARVTLAP